MVACSSLSVFRSLFYQPNDTLPILSTPTSFLLYSIPLLSFSAIRQFYLSA